MMKIKSLLTIAIAVSGITASGAFTPARSVTLVNGNFTPTNVTQSAYLGNTVASGGLIVNVPGWRFAAQLPGTDGFTANQNGYNFIAPFGDTLLRNFRNNGITASRAIELNRTGNGNAVNLYSGNTPIASPVAGATWYIAADAAFQQGAIEQTLTGLTIGQGYDVTFYQAAGQQAGFTGATTEQWQVSLGTSSKLSTLINLPSQANVTPWQQQTLSFTATKASDVLSFLAVGTPVGQPPFSLLTGVSVTPNSVTPTVVPEPFTIIGTIVGGTAALRLRKKLTKSTKNA